MARPFGEGRRGNRRALALSWCFATVTAALTGSVHAQPVTTEEVAPPAYESTIEAGVTEFSAGRFDEARALFLQAHSIFPNARTLRGIGMTSCELRDYPEAVRTLRLALAESRRALTPEQRTQVAELLDRAETFVGRFAVPPTATDAVLYVDNERVDAGDGWPGAEGQLLLGVGEHDVSIRRPDGRRADAHVRVLGRADEALAIDLVPIADAPLATTRRRLVEASAAREVDPLPWVVFGTGAAATIVGGIMFGAGYADVQRVEGAVPGTEWSTLEPSYSRGPAIASAGLVVGAAGLGLAAIGLVWALSDDGSTSSASARLRIGPGSVSWEGTW